MVRPPITTRSPVTDPSSFLVRLKSEVGLSADREVNAYRQRRNRTLSCVVARRLRQHHVAYWTDGIMVP